LQSLAPFSGFQPQTYIHGRDRKYFFSFSILKSLAGDTDHCTYYS
jgi:hypothetical protein